MSIKNGSNIFVSQEEDCIYVDGVRYVPESTNDWVSCDGRLPEIDQYVLWHTHDYNYFIEALDKDGNGWLKFVSHWKPLPEPPKDK